MRLFLSLPWKILGLLSAFFLLVSVLITNSWINKNDQDFLALQKQLRDQDQRQLQVIDELLRNRVESWFEAFVHFQKNYGNNIEASAFFLGNEYEFLQLHWQINNLWLFDSQQKLYFSSNPQVPGELLSDVMQTFQQQRSQANVRCHPVCEQFFSIPLLLNQGEIAVLAVSNSLQETLAALNRATGADMAVLKMAGGQWSETPAKTLKIQPPLASTQQQLIDSLFTRMKSDTSVADVIRQGIRIENNQHAFLINMLPLEKSVQSSHFLIFIHDITESSQLHIAFQTKILWVSVTVICLSFIAFFVLTQRLQRRLLSITRSLPLLAEKRYSEFRQHQYISSYLFADEIDNLQESATLLSTELESLDNQIEHNTRELENIAMYDRLCGLPNRNMLNHLLKAAIAGLARNNKQLAVMFLDFDNFRKINDSHGHNIGDSFLIEAARRIKETIRDSDFACRFGGDEFVVVLQHQESQQGVTQVADKLLKRFHKPLHIVGQRFYVTTSIGIVITDNPQEQVEDLIRQADMAMYTSKDLGGDRYSLFTPEMYQRVIGRVQIENEMREAIDNNEICFALQPQIEISTGKLVGFEALIRWRHPQKGLIPPDEFIPVLENSENMIQLGYWGLKRAFTILSTMEELGFKNQRIAVNLSAVQLLDPNLLPFLKQQLIDFNRDGSQIELELTERTVVADIDTTLSIMAQLKQLGFTFSIDDFGTGYSSLAYLKQMPVNIIKIDRSFVSGMTENRADMQIVSSTIAMVQKLGMKVVAEGVETTAQLRMLQDMQCEIGQGYFISKPIMEYELYDLLPEKIKNGIWNNMDKL
ncbi:EAL domain-containing protein [Neptunicella sp. SCSIO 80796]|uniref:bifunctional diguanylate cyclase/phosphodiesterase n=1 Tax=Neptunicella plasticusilytica TaxID=3117012 RepID=UPI003A4DF3D9